MSNISILPSNGTRISIGGVGGENTSATNSVQNQLEDKGYSNKASNFGSGFAVTFSQDIISANIGKKDNGLEFRAGAEMSVGMQSVKKDVKVGEKDAWVVDVRRDYWVYDQNGNSYLQTDYYTRTFSTPQEAEWYWRQVNMGYDPYYGYNAYTYANYPRYTKVDIIDRTSKTEGSLRFGVTVGIQKNFENSNIRVDALTGYDILQNNAYAGGRVTYSTGYFTGGNSKVGLYAQVDTDITAKDKDTRGQIGVVYIFK
ncbi:MAG: hypothetical protein KatS3mg068_2129 [Candidatus Sericytochromatia bacterium]|nr:MAG: hypothetical protein KatS3mg068_2129 [Candidatus Sericytochromatia bacterium]